MVFSWNDVDVLFTFNFDIFDLGLKLTFPNVTKDLDFFQHYAIDSYHFVLSI